MEGQKGGGDRGGKGRKGRVLIILAFVGVAIISAGAGVGVSWWQHSLQEHTHEGEVKFSEEVDQVQQQTMNGEYAQAQKSLDKSLGDPNISDSERHDLLIQQGVVYENEDKVDDAIEAYKKAETYKESLQAAQSIARLAVQKGDKALAITYYKKAIPLLAGESPQVQENLKKYFEEAIKHLEGSQ